MTTLYPTATGPAFQQAGSSIECVYPGCEHSRRTRGLCHPHYQAYRSRARNGVKAGLFTEEEYDAYLVRAKLLLPKGTGGAKPSCGYDLLDYKPG
jgi:hypothetical protein